MLALAEGTVLAHEPFNIQPWAYGLNGLARYWFTYAPALPQEEALAAFDAVVRQRARKIYLKNQPQHWLPALRRGRLIIKDPIAALSSDWISRNFDVEVVVLVRHPAAFAASLKRLDWRHPFDHFLRQEGLMRERLEPYRKEIESRPEDVVRQAALLWNCIYGVLFEYCRENPSWLVRRHEDLSRSPLRELRGLYDALGLKWSRRTETRVVEHTRSSNPPTAPDGAVHQLRRDSAASVSQWRKILTDEEVSYVHEKTRALASLHYGEEDWRVPRAALLR